MNAKISTKQVKSGRNRTVHRTDTSKDYQADVSGPVLVVIAKISVTMEYRDAPQMEANHATEESNT